MKIIPSLSDQSYIALLLTLSVLKRNVYDLVTYNKFSEDTEKNLIGKGEKMLEGSLSVDDYIDSIIKELEKELKIKIKLEDFARTQIETRLAPMIIQIKDNKELEKETNKKVKKDGTLKEGRGVSWEQAREEAKQISQEEGTVQHINKLDDGSYIVSDWYDDTTVLSYESGMVKESNETFAIDPRFNSLNDKDKLFILRVMSIFGIGHSGKITKPILDKTIKLLKVNYNLLEVPTQLTVSRILSQIDPQDWKRFKAKTPTDYLLNNEDKEGEIVLEQYGELKESNSPTFSIQKYQISYNKDKKMFVVEGSDLGWQFSTGPGASIALKNDKTNNVVTFFWSHNKYFGSGSDKEIGAYIYVHPETGLELHIIND
jgi:hypothetical protein